MAQDYEPLALGLRLARLRKHQKLSAAALAARVPDGTITRAVITNIETGRKPDPPVSEIMKIASALDISPLALLIDIDKPWSPLDVTGLAGKYAAMTTIEYGRASTVFGPNATRNGGFERHESQFLEKLIQAEKTLAGAEFIRSEIENPSEDIPAGSYVSWKIPTEYGDTIHITNTNLNDNELTNLLQNAITAYRTCLSSLIMDAHFNPHAPLKNKLPENITKRLDTIRAAVVDTITEFPAIDYGQHDQPSSIEWASIPPLNPNTAEPIPPTDPWDTENAFNQREDPERPPLQ
jgi:transcriptional regulator with XRE-family HTH domain